MTNRLGPLGRDLAQLLSTEAVFDWEHDPDFGAKILTSLNRTGRDVHYLFHAGSGDAIVLVDDPAQPDGDALPVVWLSPGGMPWNAVARDVKGFLGIARHGRNLIDVASSALDFTRGDAPNEPSETYPDAVLEERRAWLVGDPSELAPFDAWLAARGITPTANVAAYVTAATRDFPFPENPRRK